MQLETITGVVEEITFHNEANGFTVLDFSSEDDNIYESYNENDEIK